jgi:hypothetical protein
VKVSEVWSHLAGVGDVTYSVNLRCAIRLHGERRERDWRAYPADLVRLYPPLYSYLYNRAHRKNHKSGRHLASLTANLFLAKNISPQFHGLGDADLSNASPLVRGAGLPRRGNASPGLSGRSGTDPHPPRLSVGLRTNADAMALLQLLGCASRGIDPSLPLTPFIRYTMPFNRAGAGPSCRCHATSLSTSEPEY